MESCKGSPRSAGREGLFLGIFDPAVTIGDGTASEDGQSRAFDRVILLSKLTVTGFFCCPSGYGGLVISREKDPRRI